MVTKQDIIRDAHKNGFEDIGFTTADPFDGHRDFLLARKEEYGWAEAVGLDLINGTDPKTTFSTCCTGKVDLMAHNPFFPMSHT